jgi:hypothetical protein
MKDELPNNDDYFITRILTTRSILLAIHSDRATTFSSLFLVSIFRITIIVSVAQSINSNRNYLFYKFISLATYISFGVVGFYILSKDINISFKKSIYIIDDYKIHL